MSYKNPTPSVDDVEVAKKASIHTVFKFDENVSLTEAAHGISNLIRENGGEIPVDWVRFAEKPSLEYRPEKGAKIC